MKHEQGNNNNKIYAIKGFETGSSKYLTTHRSNGLIVKKSNDQNLNCKL